MEIELSARVISTESGAQNLIDAIKAARLGATERRKYAYNEHILAVRVYREFLAWREAN